MTVIQCQMLEVRMAFLVGVEDAVPKKIYVSGSQEVLSLVMGNRHMV